MLQRREGGLLVHGEVGELEGVVGPHVADPGARGGRHRRRERVRQGRARDLAAHQGPEVHLPRLLAGQALHDDAAEAPGGARALPHRARPHGHRDAAPGRALGRALPRLVRVLGRLPGGQDRGGRQEGLHPREAEAGALVAVVAGVGGDRAQDPRGPGQSERHKVDREFRTSRRALNVLSVRAGLPEQATLCLCGLSRDQTAVTTVQYRQASPSARQSQYHKS